MVQEMNICKMIQYFFFMSHSSVGGEWVQYRETSITDKQNPKQ